MREGDDRTSDIGSVPEDARRSLEEVRMVEAASVVAVVADGITNRMAIGRLGRSESRVISLLNIKFANKTAFL
jgi:hypothetical protein